MATTKKNAPGSTEIPLNVEANDNANKTKSAEVTEDIESNYADPSSKLSTQSNTADVMATSEANQPKDDPSPPTPTEDQSHIVVGEIDIAVNRSKVPLLGVMASTIITLIALNLHDVKKDFKYYWRYGTTLCVVSFLVALLSFVFPSRFTSVTRPANYFLFAWTFVGACFMTFHDGPFITPGNGYFGVWGSVIFSIMAAEPPGTDTSRPLLDKMKAILDLGATATVVLISLIGYFKYDYDDEDYEGETISAMVLTILTICAVGLFSIRYFIRSPPCCESQILIIFAILWIVVAPVVTFSGPFLETGNGYFSSWMTAIMSFKAASYSWKHRRDEDQSFFHAKYIQLHATDKTKYIKSLYFIKHLILLVK